MAQLLHEDEAAGEVATGAAPALVVVEAEEAELAAPAEDVVGEEPGVLPLVDVGAELLVDEAADRIAQLVVLGGEDGIAIGPLCPGTGLARELDGHATTGRAGPLSP